MRVVGEYAPDPLAIYSAKTRRNSEFLAVAYDAWHDTVALWRCLAQHWKASSYSMAEPLLLDRTLPFPSSRPITTNRTTHRKSLIKPQNLVPVTTKQPYLYQPTNVTRVLAGHRSDDDSNHELGESGAACMGYHSD